MITLEEAKAMMKILISDTPPYFVAPDAPVLGATEVTVDGRCAAVRCPGSERT